MTFNNEVFTLDLKREFKLFTNVALQERINRINTLLGLSNENILSIENEKEHKTILDFCYNMDNLGPVLNHFSTRDNKWCDEYIMTGIHRGFNVSTTDSGFSTQEYSTSQHEKDLNRFHIYGRFHYPGSSIAIAFFLS